MEIAWMEVCIQSAENQLKPVNQDQWLVISDPSRHRIISGAERLGDLLTAILKIN